MRSGTTLKIPPPPPPPPPRLLPPAPSPSPSPSPSPPLQSRRYSFNPLSRDPSMQRHMERICSNPHPSSSSSSSSSSLPPHLYPPAMARIAEAQGSVPSTFPPFRVTVDHSVPPPTSTSSSSSSSSSSLIQSGERIQSRSSRIKPLIVAQPASYVSDPNSSEPIVLAVVDMGIDAFHITVAKAEANGDFQVIDSEKENVQLGSLITPDAEARAFETMERFIALASAYGASLRVVATSAIRDAGNRGSFLGNMLHKVGIEAEVLTGEGEACLIYHGVLRALPVYHKVTLVVDVGGGSTEFVIGKAGVPVYSASVKLGHARIDDLFHASGGCTDVVGKSQLEHIREYIRNVLKESGVADHVRNAQCEVFVGSSSTIEALEQIINHAHTGSYATLLINEQAHLCFAGQHREKEFTKDELAGIVHQLCKAKSNEHRVKAFGKRAEVLVGGALLLEEVFKALSIQKMKVSPFALREGLIVDTLEKKCPGYEVSPAIRWDSVIRMAKKFYSEETFSAARHSAQLAMEILADLKGCSPTADSCHVCEVASLLNDSDAEVLKASATLHAIGMAIGFRDYNNHSHYLIKNNDILVGYSPTEIEMMALLVKYHRKKVVSKRDDDFAQLAPEVQLKTLALCAIIRIAVALNRCHKNAVKAVHLIRDSGKCALVAIPSLESATQELHDISVELWAAQDKLDLFQKVFKCSSSIAAADHDDESLFHH